MNNNKYNIYIQQCMDLTATMLIKLDDAIELINTGVKVNEGFDSVDEYNPSTWKYYQNISGEYHFSDKMMKVKSLDINKEIDFTKENLALHKLTKKAYTYGSRYYKELVLNYPHQELLILGIINPTDKETAIKAKNGTILNYNKTLIEENEYSLIDRLQTWVNNYLFRWVNRQYGLSDDLYVHTYVYQLTLHLLQAVISFRLESCKTNEVHSYHVRAYLASHGFLDPYLDALTLKQSLWFYRNIRYIERHSGKVDTFNWITEHTFTERDIPIYELKVKHDSTIINSSPVPNIKNEDVTIKELINRDPVTEVTINRDPINEPAVDNSKNNYTTEETLNLISELGKDNKVYNDDNLVGIKDDLKYSESSTVQTKLLQSYINENGNIYYYTLEDITYNSWIYLAAKGIYEASIFINVPKTNENMALTSQQAVALFMYCTYKTYMPNINKNIDSIKIPTIRVDRVPRLDRITKKELLANTDRSLLSDKDIDDIYNTSINIKPFYTIPDFTDLCLELYRLSKIQYSIYCSVEDMDKRAYTQTAIDSIYCDETVRLNELVDVEGNQIDFETLLLSIGLDCTNYEYNDYLELSTVLLASSTLVMETEIDKLTYIQKTMSSLLLQLSSYSINMINDNNELPTLIIPNVSVRVGYQYRESFTKEYLDTLLKLKDSEMTTNFKIDVNNDSLINENDEVHFISNIKVISDLSIDVSKDNINSNVQYGYVNTSLKGITDFELSGNFNTLPMSDKYKLLDLVN